MSWGKMNEVRRISRWFLGIALSACSADEGSAPSETSEADSTSAGASSVGGTGSGTGTGTGTGAGTTSTTGEGGTSTGESGALCPADPVLSPGCANPGSLAAGTHDLTHPAGSGPSPRPYRLVLPGGYDPSTPHALFFSMHACGGSYDATSGALAERLETAAGLPAITVGPDSLIVDADGDGDAQGSDGPKCWNLNRDWYDVAFIADLYQHILDTYCVDTRYVYFGGGSSGSFGAQGFGCYVGATAIVGERGGVHHPEDYPNFPPTPAPPDDACGPIPVLLGFSREDTTVAYDPFAVVASEFWSRNNGCEPTAMVDAQTQDVVCAAEVTDCRCERYEGCEAPFVLCSWAGGHDVTAIGPTTQAWWYSKFVRGAPGSVCAP